VNATGVIAGPAESNGRLLLSKWRDSLHVTCGLTACTPGSAPGPTLGNEYGKTLPFYINLVKYLCSKNRCAQKVNEANCHVRLSHLKTFEIFVSKNIYYLI